MSEDMKRRILLAALALGAVAVAAMPRLLPMAPSDWHVDPLAAERTGRPNAWLLALGGDAPPVASTDPPAAVLARLDAAAMAEPGVERLAGSPGEGLVTWVQRSRAMGFPDAVSIRAAPAGDGSIVTVFSRSRYGYSDMGVNRARVERWLAAAGL